MSTHEVARELNRAMMLSTPGFNAIAFVMRTDTRFTEQYIKLVNLFFDFFGENVEQFAFTIFTHTKTQNELSRFLTKEKSTDVNVVQPGFKDHILNKVKLKKLLELLSRCKGNITIIDNTADPEIKEIQVKAILDEIKRIKVSNFQACFQNTRYKAMEALLYAYARNNRGMGMRDFFTHLTHLPRITVSEAHGSSTRYGQANAQGNQNVHMSSSSQSSGHGTDSWFFENENQSEDGNEGIRD